MTLAYYFDEDAINTNLIRAARSRGLDVTTPIDVGMRHRQDEEHLAYAHQQGKVLFSSNVGDFCRLHGDWLRLGKQHSGMLLAHQWDRHSIGSMLRGLLRLAAQRSTTEMLNRLEYINDWI